MAAKKAKSKSGGVKKVILAIAIVIVLASFIQIGIKTFFEQPRYENYCNETIAPKALAVKCECRDNSTGSYYNMTETDRYYNECNGRFEVVNEKHSNIVFWISLITGIILFIVGVNIALSSIASGLMGGAVITIFIGVTNYWRYFENYAKLIILGIVLAILLWIGYKKLNK